MNKTLKTPEKKSIEIKKIISRKKNEKSMLTFHQKSCKNMFGDFLTKNLSPRFRFCTPNFFSFLTKLFRQDFNFACRIFSFFSKFRENFYYFFGCPEFVLLSKLFEFLPEL